MQMQVTPTCSTCHNQAAAQEDICVHSALQLRQELNNMNGLKKGPNGDKRWQNGSTEGRRVTVNIEG